LALEFAQILEEGVNKGSDGDMKKMIEDVLESDWQPSGPEHERTIYYISGFVLRTVHNRSEDKRESLASVFRELEANVSITNADAAAASLPIGRVEKMEAVSLYYASSDFYHAMVAIESVFHSLLKEANVYLFGTLMIADIVHFLSEMDLGLSQFMPNASEDHVAKVTNAIINSYANFQLEGQGLRPEEEHPSQRQPHRDDLGHAGDH